MFNFADLHNQVTTPNTISEIENAVGVPECQPNSFRDAQAVQQESGAESTAMFNFADLHNQVIPSAPEPTAPAQPTAQERMSEPVDAQTALITAASTLKALGFQIESLKRGQRPTFQKNFRDKMAVQEITDVSVAKIAAGATGLALILGERGARRDPETGKLRVPLVLETEAMTAGSTEWEERLHVVLEMLGENAREVWNRTSQSVVDRSGGGGEHRVFEVLVDDASQIPKPAQAIFEAAPGVGEQPRLMAEILTSRVTMAPTYGDVHKHGKPYTRLTGSFQSGLALLSLAEVELLRMIFEELTPLSERSAESGNAKHMSREARQVAKDYATISSPETTKIELEASGWTVMPGRGREPGEVAWKQPLSQSAAPDPHAYTGGAMRANGAITVWSTKTPLPQGFHTAFEVYAYVRCDGDFERAARELSPKVAAEKIMTARAADMAEVLVNSTRHTAEISSDFLNALATARIPGQPDEPFAYGMCELDVIGNPKNVQYLIQGRASGYPTMVNAQGEEALLMRVAHTVKAYEEISVGERTELKPVYAHDVPRGVVRTVMEDAKATPGIVAPVAQIVTEPTMTRNGAIISEPGYNREERVLVVGGDSFREVWRDYSVPDSPTREQAQEAWDYLQGEVFAQFPYDTAGDAVRAMALLLTRTMGSLVSKRPIGLVRAANAGSGKSLHRDVISALAWGSTAVTNIGSTTATDDESRKQVASAVLGGGHEVAVDNAPTGSLVNSLVFTEVCTAEDGTLKYRRLGSSVEIPIGWVNMTISGNGLTVEYELSRRCIPVTLEQHDGLLATDRREYRHPNLVQWVLSNRPTLLAAAHTINRFGVQNPVAYPAFSLATFEQWSAQMCSALDQIMVENDKGERVSAASLLGDGRSDFVEESSNSNDDWAEIMLFSALTIGGSKKAGRGFTPKEFVQNVKEGGTGQIVHGFFVEAGPLSGVLENATSQKIGKLLQPLIGANVAYPPLGLHMTILKNKYEGKATATYRVRVRRRNEEGRLVEMTYDELRALHASHVGYEVEA